MAFLFLQYIRFDCRYDFDNDGMISAEDVRMILSYVPFKRDNDDNLSSHSEGRFAGEKVTFDQR